MDALFSIRGRHAALRAARGQPFGAVAAGTTNGYRSVELELRSAAIERAASGQRVTGQTLNLGGRCFTYAIDVLDLDAGHLAIGVVRD